MNKKYLIYSVRKDDPKQRRDFFYAAGTNSNDEGILYNFGAIKADATRFTYGNVMDAFKAAWAQRNTGEFLVVIHPVAE